MYDVVAATRPRCLVVATGLTAALWGAAAVLVRELTARQPAPTQCDALVRLCLTALVVATGWAWLQGLAGVADAWRGAAGGAPGGTPGGTTRGVRRLALAACGVALAGALAAPAHADSHGPRADLLSGLPLPERAEGPARAQHPTVVVRPGDTLWALAARDLERPATDRQVTDHWHALYRRNRGVIGPDPDLILPGQVLKTTKEQT